MYERPSLLAEKSIMRSYGPEYVGGGEESWRVLTAKRRKVGKCSWATSEELRQHLDSGAPATCGPRPVDSECM